MSYEGYREYLCRTGHFFTVDAYEDAPTTCPQCGEAIGYTHSVDVTNGPIEDQPSTLPGPKELIERQDDWRTDHYGNRYAIQIPIYRPLGTEWSRR